MAMKYDEFGFLNQEWASTNIEGFDDLGSCCQQLLVLFPDIPHRCSDIIKDTPTPIPSFVLPEGTETYGGGVGGVSGYGPAAGALLVGGLLLPSDGDSNYNPNPPVSVNEPFTGLLMATSLIVVTICKKFAFI
jgi:hypothetical protein